VKNSTVQYSTVQYVNNALLVNIRIIRKNVSTG